MSLGPPAMKILLVDDCVTDQQVVSDCIAEGMPGSQVQVHGDAKSVLRSIDSQSFDCVLLDYAMPLECGMSVLRNIQRRSIDIRPAVIMMTGSGDEKLAVEAMKLGAADYICKRDLSASMLARVVDHAVERHALQQQMKEYQDQLARLALADDLTDLGNRASFNARMQQLLSAQKRMGRPFVLFMLDLNKFKQVNDEFGHLAGDTVLRETAQRLTAALRDTDAAYRLGGDEFAVLVEVNDLRGGPIFIARRLEQAISRPYFYDEHRLNCSASIGYACCPEHGTAPEALIKVADKAMYEHKRQRKLVQPNVTGLDTVVGKV